MQLIYQIFSVILLSQALFIVFLNIPTPTGIKGKIIKFISNNDKLKWIMGMHIIFILLAVTMYIDNQQIMHKYQEEKQVLIKSGNLGIDLRKSQLSYKILLIQRNLYIDTMLIFISVALDCYILLLRYLYQKRDAFELRKNLKNKFSGDREKIKSN